MKNLLLGIVATAFAVAPALAADMPLKAPPAPPALYNWQGCYVGIVGGLAWGRSRHDGYPPGPIELTPYFDIGGGVVGGELGCNFSIGGTWLAGFEGDWSWSSKSGDSFDTGPGGVPTFRSSTRERWYSTARVRLGPTFDRVFIFGTGGFAAAGVEAGLSIPGAGVFTQTRTLWGGTIGGGFEYGFNNNWSFKGEYLFLAFRNQSYDFGNPAAVVAANATRSALNVTDHMVRAALNYRFTSY